MYGKISVSLHKYEDAIVAYKQALDYNPNLPDGWFSLANAYFMHNKHDEAAKIYEKLLQQKPNDVRVQYNLAEAYLKIEKTDDALVLYEKVQKHAHRQFPHVRLKIAGCHDRLGNTAQAISLIDEVVNDQRAPGEIKALARGLQTRVQNQIKNITKTA